MINSEFRQKYYPNINERGIILHEEKQWLADHNQTIRLGYIADSLPYCDEENGQLVGVMNVLVEKLEQEFDIQVETTGFASREQLRQALKGGEIDIVGPVYSDFYLAEQHNNVLTNAFLTTTPMMIYK